MKKLHLLKTILLLCALIAGSNSAWADDVTGTINFGSADGSTKIQGSTSSGTGTVTYTDSGDDNLGNTWTITTVTSNEKSFTQFASYSQVGAGSKPVTSITLTTTLPASQTIKAFSAKFGGFSSTAGSVTLKVGDTSVGTGSLSGTSDVTVSATNTTTSGTVLTVTVTGIAKGVKCYYISYSYASSDISSAAAFANATPSINWPTATNYTQAATTAVGYTGTLTYSIGSTNTAGASINSSTGEVTVTKAGSVQVVATAPAITGYLSSTASYTLTVNDVREVASLSWSSNDVEIFIDAASYDLPTLNNPNSLVVTYSATGTEGLASVTPAGVVTVNTSITGTATIKANFAGNETYKPRNASYTISVIDPTEKGSKYNPYTVAEIIALNPTSTSEAKETGKYVIGYIIGTVNSATGALVNTNIDSDSNLAIADNPNETENFCSVQLPSGTIRTALNAKPANHPYYVGVTKVLVKGDVFKYCQRPGIKNTSSGSVVGQKVKITSSGLATYCTDVNLKFDGEVEAYIAKEEGGKINLYQVTNVPANTGVLLRATGISVDTSFDVGTTVDTDDVTGNIFVKGTDAAVATGTYNYILSKKSGIVGFYYANGNTVAKNRAYLHTTLAEAHIALDFDNDVTAIEAVSTKQSTTDGQYYNLAGQRVAQPVKGLYIVNGKKVIIK